MKKLARFLVIFACLGAVFSGFLFSGLIAANALVAGFLSIAKTLPASIANVTLQQQSRLYGLLDGEYVEFANFYEKNRIPLTYDEIPEVIINAVLSTEDPRFFDHGGVDYLAVARAYLQNTSSGSTQSGASTVTMQLVRNLLIEAAEWSGDDEAVAAATATSFSRKLLEMRYAIGLENLYSKEEIITAYLNYASFGGNVYGIAAAASYYYSKDVSELTTAEAAQLISVFPAPNVYRIDNDENISRATNRRNFVLKNMFEAGFIDEAEYNIAISEEIIPNITSQSRGCEAAKYSASYFCDYIVNLIRSDETFGQSADDRAALLRRGGLDIYTTIDLNLQQEVQSSVDANIDSTDEIGAASVVVKVGTGEVLAMSQNRSYTQIDTGDISQTSINYAVNKQLGGGQGFQAGSTYKVFTLLAWIQSGRGIYETLYAPGSITYNLSSFTDSCATGPYVGTWTPTNAGSYSSSFNVKYATAQSINSGFIVMAKQLDLCDIRNMANAFGIASQADGTELSHSPSSVIGTNYLDPLSVATAYAGIANGGLFCSSYAIVSVYQKSTSSTIYSREAECLRAVDADIAYTAIEALQGVFQSGGTASAANPYDNQAIGGKTGSTDNYYDTWLVSFTTATAQATWIGNLGTSSYKKALNRYYIKGILGSSVRYRLAKAVQSASNAIYPGDSAFPTASSAFTRSLSNAYEDESEDDNSVGDKSEELSSQTTTSQNSATQTPSIDTYETQE